MALKITRYVVSEKRINQEERNYFFCRGSFIPTNSRKGDVELEEVDVGEDIARIHTGAFEDCTSLTTVMFSDSLKRIDANAFAGCMSLQKIVLPENLNEVDCWFGSGAIKITLPHPSSEELIGYLKQGYPMDFYYKGEFRDDHWD